MASRYDPVSVKEHLTVPFGTVPLRTEPFHTSSVEAQHFQMVPEVITLEEESVINHKISYLLYLACRIIKEAKKLFVISICTIAKIASSYLFSFGSVPFDSARLYGNKMEPFL